MKTFLATLFSVMFGLSIFGAAVTFPPPILRNPNTTNAFLSAPANGQIEVWNATLKKWTNLTYSASGGGGIPTASGGIGTNTIIRADPASASSIGLRVQGGNNTTSNILELQNYDTTPVVVFSQYGVRINTNYSGPGAAIIVRGGVQIDSGTIAGNGSGVTNLNGDALAGDTLFTNQSKTHYLLTNGTLGTFIAWIPGVGLVKSNTITGAATLIVGTNGGAHYGGWSPAGAGNVLADGTVTAIGGLFSGSSISSTGSINTYGTGGGVEFMQASNGIGGFAWRPGHQLPAVTTNIWNNTNGDAGFFLAVQSSNVLGIAWQQTANGSALTNLLRSSTVSAGANVTVTPSKNADGSTNYSVASSGGGSAGTSLPNLSYEVFYEPFGFGAKGAVNGTAGALGWYTAASSGVIASKQAGHFGVTTFTTGATAGNNAYCVVGDSSASQIDIQGPFPDLSGLVGWTNTFVWKLSATNDMQAYIGLLGGNPTWTLSTTTNPPFFMGVKCDSTNSSSMQFVAISNGVVGLVASTALNTAWHTNRIWSTTAGTISFNMDEGSASTISTNIITTGTTPCALVFKTASSASVDLHLDTYIGTFAR